MFQIWGVGFISSKKWEKNIREFNPLKAELNAICHLLALLGGATIVVVSRLKVKGKKCKGHPVTYNEEPLH
jgi:hypothetical protein